MRTILHILASFLLFLLSFRIGLQVHFPMKTLQDKLIWELQNSSNWSVDIQSIDIHSLMSLQANSVSIVQRENKNKEYEEFLFIEELQLSPSLLSLLSGTPSTSLSTSLLNGEIDANVTQTKPQRISSKINGSNLDLSFLPLKGTDWQANLAGLANFSIDLDHHLTELNEGFGSLSLQVDDFQIDDLEVAGFPLIPLQFSESIIELERDGNKLNFKNGRLIGEQIEAEITGFIRLSKRLERSRLQLKIFVKFSSELELMVKAFLKDARQDDGSYLINITGMIMQPNFQQKTRGNRSKNTSKAKSNRTKRTDGKEKKETPEEEEARIKREEQREKRLERQKKRMEERQRRMQNAPKVAPNQQKLTPRDLPIRSNIGNVDFDDEVEISDDDEEEDISDEEEEEEEEIEEEDISDDEDMDEEE